MKLLQKKVSPKRPIGLLALSLSVAMLSISASAADTISIEGFTITPLEAPIGFSGVFVKDINDQGIAVGSSRNVGDSVNRAMIWDAKGNGSELLGHGGFSDNNGFASAINNSGQVVGSADGSGTIWFDGTDTAGEDISGLYLDDINDAGSFVAKDTLFNTTDLQPTLLTPIYEELNLTEDAKKRVGFSINANNNIAGTVIVRNTGYIASAVIKPILIEDNSFKLLGTLPEFEEGDANAVDINDNKQIVGVSYEYESTPFSGRASKAVIWEEDLIATIGTFGGDSNAVAINNLGQIIGNSEDDSGVSHAYIWQNEVMYDLSVLLCDDSFECRTYARAINDNNEIIVAVNSSSTSKTYRIQFEESALDYLPGISAPLYFVSPVGSQSGGGSTGGGGNTLEGADISVSLKTSVTRLKRKQKLVSYRSLLTNAGPNVAKNLVSTFILKGTFEVFNVFTNSGSCDTKTTQEGSIMTVTCQHGDLNPGQIISKTVEIKAKRLRRLNAIDAVESDINDPNTSNNSVKLKGI